MARRSFEGPYLINKGGIRRESATTPWADSGSPEGSATAAVLTALCSLDVCPPYLLNMGLREHALQDSGCDALNPKLSG